MSGHKVIHRPRLGPPVDELLGHDEVSPGNVRPQLQEPCDSGKTSATWIDEEEQENMSKCERPGGDCIRVVRQESEYDPPFSFF